MYTRRGARADLSRYAPIIVCVALVAIHVALCVRLAIEMGQMYVSDEVWYVEAARNLANDLGILPNPHNCTTVPLRLGNVTVIRLWLLDKLCRQLGLSCTAYGRNASMAWVCGEPAKILLLLYTLHLPARFGWRYASREPPTILFYYNWEHPPLYKYLLIAEMSVCDNPVCWRSVSIFLGAAAMVLAMYAAYRVAGIAGETIAGISMLLSPAFNDLGTIAILDIAPALSLAAILAIYARQGREASPLSYGLALGIGVASKWTALFNLGAIIVLWGWRNALKALIVAGVFYVLVYVPLAIHYGVPLLVRETLWAIRWHTMAKCIGPHCPPWSAPWDWLFANRLFPMYVSPHLAALPDFLPFEAIAVLAALGLKAVARCWSELDSVALAAFPAVFGGYILLYLLGDITQYSYYTGHLAPGLAVAFAAVAVSISDFATRRGREGVARLVKAFIKSPR